MRQLSRLVGHPLANWTGVLSLLKRRGQCRDGACPLDAQSVVRRWARCRGGSHLWLSSAGVVESRQGVGRRRVSILGVGTTVGALAPVTPLLRTGLAQEVRHTHRRDSEASAGPGRPAGGQDDIERGERPSDQ